MPVLVFLEGRMSCGYLADGSTTWPQRLWGKWAQKLTRTSCLSPKLQMFMLLGINGFDFNYIPFVRMKLTRIGWWLFNQTRIYRWKFGLCGLRWWDHPQIEFLGTESTWHCRSLSSWSDFCLFSARSGTSFKLETGQSPTNLWKQKSGYWAAARELRGCWQKPTWAKRLRWVFSRNLTTHLLLRDLKWIRMSC